MRMWWADFFIDPKVRAMPPVSRGIYLLLLGELWMNGGWLKDDDRHLAARLQMDVRAWRQHRRHIEPAIKQEIDRTVGPIITQGRLQRELRSSLDLIDHRKAQTAAARAKRWGKAGTGPSVTETRPPPRAEPVTEHVTSPETGYGTGSYSEPDKKEGRGEPPGNEASEARAPLTVPVGSLRSAPGGEVDAPSDPALVKRLVSDGLKRSTGTSLFDRLGMGKEDGNGTA